MATRAEVKRAFYDTLTDAVVDTHTVDYGTTTDTVTVEADDVRLLDVDVDEEPLGVFYTDSYLPLNYNGVGDAPWFIEYDDDDNVERLEWHEYMEAQFTVYVRAPDEASVEPLYESVRTHFHRYFFDNDMWDPRDIHSDVTYVDVADGLPADSPSVDRTIRGDQLLITLHFRRRYAVDVADTDDPSLIETIRHLIDETTLTYTTT